MTSGMLSIGGIVGLPTPHLGHPPTQVRVLTKMRDRASEEVLKEPVK